MSLAWTKEEDQYIIKNFRKLLVEEIARRLERTPSAVKQRALKRLSLPRIRRVTRKGWEPQEDEFLERNYGNIPTQHIARNLGRTLRSIYGGAKRLGLMGRSISGPHWRWRTEDEEYVLANFGKVSTEEIAKHLNRTPAAIYLRATHPRTSAPIPTRSRNDWTLHDEAYLRSNYLKLPIDTVSMALGRPIGAIHSKAQG